jgi:hypothetical protein
MKKLLLPVLALILAASGLPAQSRYSLEYQISGSAVSRLLFIFPLRVYYDTSASIHFKAAPRADGGTRFVFEELSRSAYLVRTLGFSGKTLAVLTADTDSARAESFRESLLARWRMEVPEFAQRAKSVKKFPHGLLMNGKEGLAFTRNGQGGYGDFVKNLQTRYVHYPSQTGIYFNIFLMLEDFLDIMDHPFLPQGLDLARVREFPVSWNGDRLDLSRALNRLGTRLEKVVSSLVTIEQQYPFRMAFRVAETGPEEVEICGEAFPDVPIWKSFMIREVIRRVRVRLADGALLQDEIWIGIRNSKGQGGFGRLQLKRID